MRTTSKLRIGLIIAINLTLLTSLRQSITLNG